MVGSSASVVKAANEYFDTLVKSRFNELIHLNPHLYELGDLISIYSTQRCDNDVYPILSITKEDGVVLQNEKFKKRIASIDVSSYKIVPRGKLIQGIHIDERNFAIQDLVDYGVVSPAYKVYSIKEELVEPVVLEYYLRSNEANAYIRNKFRGSIKRRESITKEDLFKMPILLPELSVQSEIVKFVVQVDKSKLLFQQMVSKYDELVKSRFIEMFKPFMNEGHLCMLEKLTNLFTDGNWIESKDQSQSGIRLIQTGNIGNAQYLDKAERSRFIDEETFVRLKCTEVVPGDVLVSRLPDPIGRSCIVPTDLGTMITGVDCTIIRFTDKINPVFFITYTLTDQYKSQIIEFEAGSTRKRISRKNLGKILVPVPPIELQNQFADFVKQVDKSKSEILEGIKRLNLPQNN